MSFRNWLDEEWPKLAIWMIALAAGYLAWLCLTSLWENDLADNFGVALAFGVSFSILSAWQMIWNRVTGDWPD